MFSDRLPVLVSASLTSSVSSVLLICGATPAAAQQCPRSSASGPFENSAVRDLRGELRYHDGIRQWYELKLDRPACGEPSIQITASEATNRRLETLRGCRVEVRGAIGESLTGYYSRNLYQDAASLKPLGACSLKPRLPDYSSRRPDRSVRAYTVYMHVDYRPGDHPVVFDVRAGRKALRPWRAYASYMLTGGFVLYGLCGRGFVVDRVFGTAAARPTHSDDPRDPSDMATFDPETAAQSGTSDLRLGYTCIRGR